MGAAGRVGAVVVVSGDIGVADVAGIAGEQEGIVDSQEEAAMDDYLKTSWNQRIELLEKWVRKS